MEEKIRFKDLSFWLKLAITNGLINLLFMLSWIIALTILILKAKGWGIF